MDNAVEEESWNCNVRICVFLLFSFIFLIFLLNYRLNSDKIVYCDSTMSLTMTDNCTQCPSFAECAKGVATYEDDGYILHPKKGCLPQKQFEQRRDGEILYLKLYNLLKQQRRRAVINCDDRIQYGMNGTEIGHYFHSNLHHFYWKESQFEDAMESLSLILLEQEAENKIKQNVSNQQYYAVLNEWEMTTTQDCNQWHWMMLHCKVYGIEISISIVCASVLLMSWRRVETLSF